MIAAAFRPSLAITVVAVAIGFAIGALINRARRVVPCRSASATMHGRDRARVYCPSLP
jgi:hypothetical protein